MCASNNVPDHRFFTIGALYFLDIAGYANGSVNGDAAAGISRLRSKFAVRLQYGPTGREAPRNSPRVRPAGSATVAARSRYEICLRSI
ncbi:hypothetical protein PUN4_860027 [Paraburkholderia unamae]|nr:hypothetical protein PUN4_860027 [Paraburkholderia unamae]